MGGTLAGHYSTPQLHDGIFNTTPYPPHPSLASQPDIGLDPFQFDPQLDSQPEIHHPHDRTIFDSHAFVERPEAQPPRLHDIRSHVLPLQPPPPSTSSQVNNVYPHAHADSSLFGVLPRATQQQVGEVSGGQFGVLSPHPQLLPQHLNHDEQLGRLQHDLDPRPITAAAGGTTAGHFSDMKIVPNPPRLDEWRRRLFDVDDVIALTEDEFQTYFPHVDNIYSHRSTQRYKRKPFVSHYWDCRLKGRPPGTAKSEDPNKKKRKRQARERDLCDVKIKITEYFPGARALMGPDHPVETPTNNKPMLPTQNTSTVQNVQPINILRSNDGRTPDQPGSDGARYYTIQRVNGNGANGKGDGTAGGHKHTLEDSDRVKKCSIYRHYLKEEKEKRKSLKSYHKKATGAALNTVKKHSKDHDLKLYGSCFCPFVQRVWISLEVKGLSYQYIEVDPYKKPDELMRVNPRGLIPALQHGDWGCYESSVLMEYLEDLNAGAPLLPQGDARNRAHCRLWSDHINRKILPHFYGLLQAQDEFKQLNEARELTSEIKKIVDAADPAGPFFLGPHISFVDIQFAPWIIRLRRVLTPYRGWPAPDEGSRWARWVNAVEENEGVKSTTSTDELYIDSYERYAENRPNTSQVANAINEGHGLP
ncbi:hypothetical protein ACLMJK_003959 [Lecanora helva]